MANIQRTQFLQILHCLDPCRLMKIFLDFSILATSVLALLASSVYAAGPTYADVRYSKKYDRSVLDIWQVKSGKPAPLVIYFHGGGFKVGDKAFFRRNPILKYHSKGIAFASVNYPFLVHTNKDYFKIMNHAAEAIRFLQANAGKYNIDKTRVSVMGASAGALISCHLGHGVDLSIRSVFAIQQPMGTPLLTYPKLHKKGSSIILYNSSSPKDRVHHPDNAALVHKRCEELGVTCAVYGSRKSGLPELPAGQNIHDVAMKFFHDSWALPFPEK